MQTIRPLRFPDDWLRFLYWVFFKPIALYYYIYAIDPSLSTVDDPSIFQLWRRREEHPEFTSIIQFSFLNSLIAPWLIIFPIALLFRLVGLEVIWLGVIFSAAFGMAVGVMWGIAFGVVLGVTGGVVVSVVFGVMSDMMAGVMFGFGLTRVAAYNIAVSVVFGAVFGMVLGIILGVAFGIKVGVKASVVAGMMIGAMFGMVVSAVFSVKGGVAFGVVNGVMSSLSFVFSYCYIFVYIFEAPYSWLPSRVYKGKGLKASPAMWDEVIWFPLPNLDLLLVKISKENLQDGLEAISYIASSLRQSWAARNAIIELTAHDIVSARTLPAIAEISKVLAWLPKNARADYMNFFPDVEQISQHAHAAIETETIYNYQEQLRLGLALIQRMNQSIAYENQYGFAESIIQTFQFWEKVFSDKLSEANSYKIIPNVYVAGSPLIKNSKSFKGRKDLFIVLSNELVNASGQRPALLLFGARRMGKTSTLKQLPVQLGPQIIPVSFDLQKASTVENAVGLFYLIAHEMVKSAYEERHTSLPELTKSQLESDPYLAFQEWLEVVEQALGNNHWILLALDEFESLGDMKDAGRIDDRIFQLLRGIIQGHPRFTVMMSGAHTLEELPPYWSNYFINTKTLKVSPLLEVDAMELITRPIEKFPLTYDQNAIDFLLYETGCHPNWLQLACRETVEKLNNEKRFHAKLEDVEYAVAKVPEVLAGDFRDLWLGYDSDDLKRSVLKTISKEEKGIEAVKLAKKFEDKSAEFQTALDFLLRRDMLINKGSVYTFRSNLLRRWVSKQA